MKTETLEQQESILSGNSLKMQYKKQIQVITVRLWEGLAAALLKDAP